MPPRESTTINGYHICDYVAYVLISGPNSFHAQIKSKGYLQVCKEIKNKTFDRRAAKVESEALYSEHRRKYVYRVVDGVSQQFLREQYVATV